MNDNTQAAAGFALGMGVILFIIIIALGFYIFNCFCYKKICEKCGHQPGALIWIPLVHFIPLIQAAGMPVWTIVLMFVPLVNFIFLIVLFAKLCVARGKSGWLVILMFIPLANLVFIPYLAFSE